MEIIRYEKTNICRRFNDPRLVKFVNSVVNFKKFDLPEIEFSLLEDPATENPVKYIKGNKLNDKSDDNAILTEAKKIFDSYRYEVEEYNRKPNDFLIINPFCKNNKLFDTLTSLIRDYWRDKEKKENPDYDPLSYKYYAIFHRSEEGKSIDLKQSTDATRLVSIHTAKGDGRAVVFVTGLSENSLKYHRCLKGQLKYESLVHVALTRMKEKLYIHYDDIGGDIYQRYQKHSIIGSPTDIKPYLSIESKIKYNDIIPYHCYDIICEYFKLDPFENLDDNKDNKQIIDIEHHYLRYGTMCVKFMLNIVAHENQLKKNKKEIGDRRQFVAILLKIKNAPFEPYDSYEPYYRCIYDKKFNDKKKPIIPIVHHQKGSAYSYCSNKIAEITRKIKNDLISFLHTTKINNNILKKDPLESLILYYLTRLFTYNKISQRDVDDIVNIYKEEDKFKYLKKNHYDLLCNFDKSFDLIIKSLPNNTNFLTDHYVEYYYDSKYDDSEKYKIYKRYDFIAYTHDSVIIFYISPQFNNLNYNKLKIDTLFDTFLIKNANGDNKIRFDNKNVRCCIISLNRDPYYFDWDTYIHKHGDFLKLKLCETLTEKYKENNYELFHLFLSQFKNNNSQKTMKIIKEFEERFKGYFGDNKYPPLYATKFLRYLIVNSKNKMKITSLQDQDKFNAKLNKYIERSIGSLFGFISDSDSDSDSDEDRE